MNKKIITITLILLFLFLTIQSNRIEAEYYLSLGQRLLRKGDQGADVAILQRKLKSLYLYQGEIDGLFGQLTDKAVRLFQNNNGITIDGIVGTQTLQYLPKEGLISRMDKVSRDDIILMARIIYGEARGESFEGMVAVGAVILNRVKSDKFPNTIREVILQNGQFSCLLDGQSNYYPSKIEFDAAKAALLGYDPTYNALFFYNPQVATNLAWISQRPVVTVIENHIFAR